MRHSFIIEINNPLHLKQLLVRDERGISAVPLFFHIINVHFFNTGRKIKNSYLKRDRSVICYTTLRRLIDTGFYRYLSLITVGFRLDLLYSVSNSKASSLLSKSCFTPTNRSLVFLQ